MAKGNKKSSKNPKSSISKDISNQEQKVILFPEQAKEKKKKRKNRINQFRF